MRLIDAISLLDNHTKTIRVRGKLIGYVTHEDISNAPTVDAEPVRHGRWKRTNSYPNIIFCSECGEPFEKSNSIECWNYCPNCGARMDVQNE